MGGNHGTLGSALAEPPPDRINASSDLRETPRSYRLVSTSIAAVVAVVTVATIIVTSAVQRSASRPAVGPSTVPTSTTEPNGGLDQTVRSDLIFLRSRTGRDTKPIFTVIDSELGTKREVGLEGLPANSIGAVILRTDSLVFTNSDTVVNSSNRSTSRAYSFPLSLEGRPGLLSPDPVSDLFASVAPDRVWLVRGDRGMPRQPDGNGAVWEVDQSGRVTTPLVSYDLNYRPVAAVDGGFVRERRTGSQDALDFWNPRTGEVRQIAGNGRLIDVHGSTVAWLGDRDGLHLTDVRTGTDRVVRRPSEAVVFSGSGAFSPDGRRLAAQMVDAVEVGGSPPPIERFATDEPFSDSWTLVDVRAMTSQSVEGSESNHGFSAGGYWSADSQSFLFSKLDEPVVFGPGPTPTGTMFVYEVGSDTARPLVPVPAEDWFVAIRRDSMHSTTSESTLRESK